MGRRIHESTEVQAPVQNVFRYWSNFENFSKFLQNVEEVRTLGQDTSHWRLKGPLGESVEFDTRTIEMDPSRGIRWITTEGEFMISGEVRFEAIGPWRTRVDVTMNYADPSGGAVGTVVATVFVDLQRNLRKDLESFKEILEEQVALDLDLGERRGGAVEQQLQKARSDAAVNGETNLVDAVFSAEAPQEIALYEEAVIDVRLELANGATPLTHSIDAPIDLDEEIVAILMVHRSTLEVVGARVLKMSPPTQDKPTISAFVVSGKDLGPTQIAIMFRQGASDLGTISFTATVVPRASQREPVRMRIAAASRDVADDETLVLLIDERPEAADMVRYHYYAHWKPFQWNYVEFKSEVFKDPGGKASTPLNYVKSIYQRIVGQVLLNAEDLHLFDRKLKAIGTDMCRQLFDPEFVRVLWDRRSDLRTVQVTSWEPYIPWELVRLKHPETGTVDDKFLSEYGLVRSFSGRSGPVELKAERWRYLQASFPNNSYHAVGQELQYLTNTLPERGINPRPIPASAADLLDALAKPDYDILHIACHGKTEMPDIEQTELILSDRRTPQGVIPVTLDPTTVREDARLKERLPLIFVNACETGQQAPSLTDWGGWPRAFWEGGAGAFVGTSWSVREKPASTFATAFYDALLGGATLAEAAAAGRAAAKGLGDGSWLAYVVYGNPMAKINGTSSPSP